MLHGLETVNNYLQIKEKFSSWGDECKRHCQSEKGHGLKSCTEYCGTSDKFENVPLPNCKHHCYTNSDKSDALQNCNEFCYSTSENTSLKSCKRNCGSVKHRLKVLLPNCKTNCHTTSTKEVALPKCKSLCTSNTLLPKCKLMCNTTSTKEDALLSCESECGGVLSGTKEFDNTPLTYPLPTIPVSRCKKWCFTTSEEKHALLNCEFGCGTPKRFLMSGKMGISNAPMPRCKYLWMINGNNKKEQMWTRRKADEQCFTNYDEKKTCKSLNKEKKEYECDYYDWCKKCKNKWNKIKADVTECTDCEKYLKKKFTTYDFRSDDLFVPLSDRVPVTDAELIECDKNHSTCYECWEKWNIWTDTKKCNSKRARAKNKKMCDAIDKLFKEGDCKDYMTNTGRSSCNRCINYYPTIQVIKKNKKKCEKMLKSNGICEKIEKDFNEECGDYLKDNNDLWCKQCKIINDNMKQINTRKKVTGSGEECKNVWKNKDKEWLPFQIDHLTPKKKIAEVATIKMKYRDNKTNKVVEKKENGYFGIYMFHSPNNRARVKKEGQDEFEERIIAWDYDKKKIIGFVQEYNTGEWEMTVPLKIYVQTGCLGGNNLILTRDKGKILLKDLRAGDYVKSINGEWKPIYYMRNHGSNKILHYKIKFDDNTEVVLTPDHLIFNEKNKLVRADSLRIGSKVTSSLDDNFNIITMIDKFFDIPFTPCIVEGVIDIEGKKISCWSGDEENAKKMDILSSYVQKEYNKGTSFEKIAKLSHEVYEIYHKNKKDINILHKIMSIINKNDEIISIN